MAFNAFGFSFSDEKLEKNQKIIRSPIEPERDGSISVSSIDGFGTPVAYTLDLDGSSSSENRIIEQYRQISLIPEVDRAVEEIISEIIIGDQVREIVTINLDHLDLSDNIKASISKAFGQILSLLHFKTKGYDIVRRWYIDGRVNYHIMIDEKNFKKGIAELRYVDPKKLKKIRETKKKRETYVDPLKISSTEYVEYYIYNEKGIESSDTKNKNNANTSTQSGVNITKESIATSNSGLFDPSGKMIVSFLHKALRAANNLRMMEDAVVIYRLARAPERRIFYVDVGNLPKGRSEQYMQKIMAKYKNKIVYDATTGEVKDDRRHLAMTEDYWIPRREGSTGTEIDTLPGGENLGEMTDIEYFKRKLYEALNVPMSRLSNEPAMFGRGTEITRDEIRFARFISRLRTRFSMLFDDLLGKQLVLTGVMSWEFWEKIKEDVLYDFSQDNYYAEAMQTEILQQRLGLLNEIQPMLGIMFSKEYAMKRIMMMTDEEISDMKKQIEKENKENPPETDLEDVEGTQPKTESEKSLYEEISEKELEKSMTDFFNSLTESQKKLKDSGNGTC